MLLFWTLVLFSLAIGGTAGAIGYNKEKKRNRFGKGAWINEGMGWMALTGVISLIVTCIATFIVCAANTYDIPRAKIAVSETPILALSDDRSVAVYARGSVSGSSRIYEYFYPESDGKRYGSIPANETLAIEDGQKKIIGFQHPIENETIRKWAWDLYNNRSYELHAPAGTIDASFRIDLQNK